VKAVLEAHDRLPAGIVPRHLDGVLYCLGAAIDQERPLGVIAGCDPIQPLRQLNVGLVTGNGKADVGVTIELGPNRLDYPGMAVPGVHHPDSAGEIDQPVAVHIGNHRAFSVRHCNRGHCRNTAGHCLGPTRQQRSALRTGDLGLEMDYTGHPVLRDRLELENKCRMGELIAARAKK
jgi:hypothetical protein